MTLIDTYVTCTGSEVYPARLNPDARWNGWVCPAFTLDTVRQIAADTQAAAERNGHLCTDTIHVTDGGFTSEGEPQALVMRISWLLLDEGDSTAIEIIKPSGDGMYAIGSHAWCWSEVEDRSLTLAHNAAWDARNRALKESVRRAGEILRLVVPGVSAAGVIVEHGKPRLISVVADQAIAWRESDEGGSPLDDDVIGDATDVLAEALEFGSTPEALQSGGWTPMRNTEGIAAYVIEFPAPVPGQIRRTPLPAFPRQQES
ncbi:hypothetical protein ACFWH1_18535 [Streptomyces sp. NPDC127037]|uniref:hypothetical protein n=1 Tax=Streptomyces sp. NPDC127037 TaxID=3347113 RepID=UPI003659290C